MSKKKIAILSLSAFIVVIAICLFLFMFFFGMTDIQTNGRIDSSKKTVICIGDSITYGYAIPNRDKNSYPEVLASMLNDTHNVLGFGVSGSTVQDSGDQPYTKTSAFKKSVDVNADIVIIMLGTNDSKPENWNGEEAFIASYDKLISNYQKDGAKIYICTPPVAHENIDLSPPITSFDVDITIVPVISEALKKYATDKGFELIDINAFTMQHDDFYYADGVHLDAVGAKAVAEYIYDIIK